MQTSRKPISKKTRFDIFKRDEFTCQYCGRTPPTVVLEVDHIQAVSKGGDNAEHNLLTACFDCNRGKGPGDLAVTPIDTSERIERLKEKRAQLVAYNRLLAKQKKENEATAQRIIDAYDEAFEGWTLTASAKTSICKFLDKLPEIKVVEAMDLACTRMDRDRAFKYFCGVCWRMIKDD